MRRHPLLPHGAATAVGAFAIWASAFTLLYIVQALGCRFRGAETILLHRATMYGIWIVHLVPLTLLLIALLQSSVPMRRVAILGTAAALGATAWTGLPLFFASACQ